MPKSLYNWTAEDVVRFLKVRSFYLNYAKGSHYFYVGYAAGAFRQVCIPFHGSKALKPRTLKGIIRQSGVPRSEWLNGRR